MYCFDSVFFMVWIEFPCAALRSCSSLLCDTLSCLDSTPNLPIKIIPTKIA